MMEHGSRIGVIEKIDDNIFYTGSRDRTVRLNDKRTKYTKILHKWGIWYKSIRNLIHLRE